MVNRISGSTDQGVSPNSNEREDRMVSTAQKHLGQFRPCSEMVRQVPQLQTHQRRIPATRLPWRSDPWQQTHFSSPMAQSEQPAERSVVGTSQVRATHSARGPPQTKVPLSLRLRQ